MRLRFQSQAAYISAGRIGKRGGQPDIQCSVAAPAQVNYLKAEELQETEQ